ncbi:metal ABC transporter solute-binding protein, Zn/Mn family [Luteibaculum oceani]|uniref:Manganese transporter n=1 Tax=Luteibaculum oceani TaxID=1294296 RepID=A0A5C6V9J1_9FLAO|nr:zinc ABC transporter substrate-binding protein [Luteibaculum oceani]TXC82163.1 manganese transporter [Luteibaculum oceani]
MTRKITILSLLFCAIQISCNNQKQEDYTTIVCTTNIIGDLLQQICPDNYKVVCMMGPGVDPHIYKPKPSDIRDLQDADVIVKNGLHLEGKMSEILENLGAEKMIISVAEGISDSSYITTSEFQDGVDPHLWFDPCIWWQGIEYTANKLKEYFPEDAQKFDDKLNTYKKLFFTSISATEDIIFSIPPEQRVLVTAHDAFSYFAKRYEFELLTIQGLSTQVDFSIKTIEELSNSIVEKKVPCAFVESSVPKKSINTLISVCRQKGHNLRLGGTLYSDALGAPQSSSETYLGMFRNNAKQIANCLN